MNQSSIKAVFICLVVLIFIAVTIGLVLAQKKQTPTELDIKVAKFLNKNRKDWHDWNVPYEDGKVFLDYIRRLPNYQTSIDRSSGLGISISYKKSN